MPRQRAAREAGAAENSAQHHPSADDASSVAEPCEAVQAADNGERSGDDVRQRGWFWHWNSMVTQYAPLLGLKGIGLLNSYTVWTDRREHSPYHGYAFPSQASEAAFYGEDRAELITINKILVALDLIEIRKEMVQRTDEQGRRWRVPHNFYRVKDRSDGLDLRTDDVLRVVELAAVDKGVFRFIRRIFSTKFAPIDRANVWHTILIELDEHPTWCALREQATALEARNSARSKAGHRRRAGSADQDEAFVASVMTAGQLSSSSLSDDEQTAWTGASRSTTVATTNGASGALVDDTNSGSALDVGVSNDGSTVEGIASVVESNQAPRSSVAASNSTYHQTATTTTTTDTAVQSDHPATAAQPARAYDASFLEDTPVAAPAASVGTAAPGGLATERDVDRPDGSGPLGDPGALVVSLFEAANDRRASKLERVLLSELERDADAAARRAGTTGSDWVAAALREAVASGSAFVAPKRIREIINRWTAEGAGPAGKLTLVEAEPSPVAPTAAAPRRAHIAWERALAQMRRSVDDSTFDRLFSSSDVHTVRGDTLSVRVTSSEAAEKLGREYRGLVERSLAQAFGRSMTVRFVATPADEQPAPAARVEQATAQLVVPVEDAEHGRQLWTAVLSVLRTQATPADLDRLASVVPLGQSADGELLLGLPNRQAGRLIEGRYRALIATTLAEVLGRDFPLRLIERSGWSIAR